MKKLLLAALLAVAASTAAVPASASGQDPWPYPICPEGTWGCPGPDGGEGS